MRLSVSKTPPRSDSCAMRAAKGEVAWPRPMRAMPNEWGTGLGPTTSAIARRRRAARRPGRDIRDIIDGDQRSGGFEQEIRDQRSGGHEDSFCSEQNNS